MITTSDIIIIICLFVALISVIVLLIDHMRPHKTRLTLYPVVIEEFPSGLQMVLVRALETHAYGGWFIGIDAAVGRFGEMVRKLPVVLSSAMEVNNEPTKPS